MPLNTDRSQQLFEQAQNLFPGGVNSPARAFRAVGGKPLIIARGQGPFMFDVDGNRYIDYVLSWGPLIVGHAHPQVVADLKEAAERGTSYGAPCPQENELALLVQEFLPNMERMRFVNSGTEATMSALRVARAFTSRDKIIKFEGCYHGHADYLLVKAGSGVATLGLPDSPGVPAAVAKDTLVAPYNDLTAVARLFEEYRGQIAAVIIEPVVGNMGVVPPVEGFLAGLRKLTEENQALLILDEVMTGFRVHPGGAQTLYGIKPDLITLGKVIGGGLPVGAYGGRRDIMEIVAPAGPVYQAGTLSGNPLAMAGGIATLREIKKPGVWEALNAASAKLCDGIQQAADQARVPVTMRRVGTMFTIFFAKGELNNWSSIARCDKEAFARFFRRMLEAGVYLPPSQFEAGFVSTMHNEHIIQQTIDAAGRCFPE